VCLRVLACACTCLFTGHAPLFTHLHAYVHEEPHTSALDCVSICQHGTVYHEKKRTLLIFNVLDLTSAECRKCVQSCEIRKHIDEILLPHRKQGEFDEDTFPNGGVLGTLFDNELYNGDPVLPSGLPLVILSLPTRQLMFHTFLRSSHDNHTDAVIVPISSFVCVRVRLFVLVLSLPWMFLACSLTGCIRVIVRTCLYFFPWRQNRACYISITSSSVASSSRKNAAGKKSVRYLLTLPMCIPHSKC
jgi:hypothetical protein